MLLFVFSNVHLHIGLASYKFHTSINFPNTSIIFTTTTIANNNNADNNIIAGYVEVKINVVRKRACVFN